MTRRHVTSPYAEGVPRPAAGPPPTVPVVAQYLALASAVGTTALLVALGVIATVRQDAIMSWWWSTSPEDGGIVDLMDTLVGLSGVTNLVAFVATCVWLLGIRRVAEWGSPRTHHRRSSSWAVLGWIVPVVSLWFPYQVVADASRAVGSRVTDFWPWWIAWLALTFYPVVDALNGDFETAADLMLWIRTQQVGAVIALVACVLWWRVVRSATQGAEATAKGD